MPMSLITGTLFLSGADAAANQALVSSRAVTLIINATLEQPCFMHPGVECVRVPIADQPHALLCDHFESVADLIHNNHKGSTLVHCSAGMSRSPSLVMAYLMRYKGVTLQQAHNWVLNSCPYVRPNAGFWRQLLDYERDLHGRNSVKMASTPLGVLPEAKDLEGKGKSKYCLNW